MALVSVLVAAVAVLLVARGDTGTHIHMLVATALGVALAVLLGAGLMLFTLLSASSDHDEQASRFKDKE